MSIYPIPPQDADPLKPEVEPPLLEVDAITEAWAQALKADQRAERLFKELDGLRTEVKVRAEQAALMRHVANVLSATTRVDRLAPMLLDVLQGEFGGSQGLVWTIGENTYEARAGMHFDRRQLESLRLPVPHPFPAYPVLSYQCQWLELEQVPPALRLIQARQDHGLFLIPFEQQTLLVGFVIMSLPTAKVFSVAEQESMEVLQSLFASALYDTWLLQELKQQKELLAKEKEDLKAQSLALDHQNQLLRQGQTFKVEFLGFAARELRGPLLGILNLVGRVRGGLEADVRETLLLDALLAGKHMAELLRDLAELARPGASGLPMEIRPLELGGLFQELRPLVESFPRRGEGSMHWPDCLQLPEVLADRSVLGQILLSFCAGALEGSQDGSLRVWIERMPMSISICVLLPGLQLPEGTQVDGRLLRPDDVYVQGQAGAGLGLVICSQLMDAMEGALIIDGSAGEAGTVISLELAIA